jgi:putative SOS response-associated peptidase YedK
MCGRLTNTKKEPDLSAFLWRTFSLEHHGLLNHQPQYNIAPSQKVWSVIHDQDHFRFGSLRWGLLNPARQKSLIINARSETVRQLPTFRQSFLTLRCLILMDGFYEWDQRFQRHHVYYFYHQHRLPILFAGIWFPQVNAQGETIYSMVLLTTKASAFMQPIHDRLPVMLNPDQYRFWLHPKTNPDELSFLFEPENFKGLTNHQVSTYVNASQHNNEQCIQPLQPI